MRFVVRVINDLTDTQRRWLCRSGFALLVLVPLLLVIALIYHNDARSEWEARCTAALGLKTRIARVETLTPYHIVLSDVEVSDSEVGWVARIDRVQVTRHEDRWSVLVDQTTIRPELLARIVERLENSLQIPATRQDDIELTMRGVHWAGAESSQDSTQASSQTRAPESRASWDRVAWFRQASPDSVTLSGKLFPAGSQELGPIEIRVEHSRSSLVTAAARSSEAPATRSTSSQRDSTPKPDWSIRCTVNTREHAIDLAWLELTGWSHQSLGEEASFAGEFEYSVGVDGTISCELVGDLIDVDLRQLVGERFRQVMEGRATLHCSRLRIEEGRLIELAGSLESNRGLIGMPLLRSLAAELRLQTSPVVDAVSDASVPFKSLGVRFELTGETLSLGGFDTSVLAYGSQNEMLLSVGHSLRLKPQDLIRALVPDSTLHVPLTRETVALMNWFPVPSRAELEPETRAPPRGVPLGIEQ